MHREMKKPTLALLHFQNDICATEGQFAPKEPDALARYAQAIDRTQVLLGAARKAGVPIVHSAFGRESDGHFVNRHGRMLAWIHQVGGCIEGEVGHEFVPQLNPVPGEIVTKGSGLSAFLGGSVFGDVLAHLGTETLLIAGITTHWAVEGTVRIAADMGYDCVVLSDCVASAQKQNHESALERLGFIAQVIESEAAISALEMAT